MRVEAMSEIQASPWLGEVEVCDCGIWSFSFPFFIFWYIGLKVCNTLALSFCAARLFESSLWLLILDESFLVAALPPACCSISCFRKTRSEESWEIIAKSYRIMINKAWKASGSSFGYIFDV